MKSLIPILLLFSFVVISCNNAPQNTETSDTKDAPSTEADIQIKNDGVFINHKSYGDGPYTLLFVHGWCIDQTYWSNQVEALNTDYKVVTIDLPGFGESGTNRATWSIEAYGSDINAVIDQLQLDNVILVGHSMGGDIVLESALHNEKVIAVVGVDNFKQIGGEFTEEMEAEINAFMEMLKSNFSEIAPAYAESVLFHPSTDSLVKARVMEDFKTNNPEAAISSLEELFKYAYIEEERLSMLKQKLYLINSDATPTNTDGLANTGIAYEVMDINSTGHYPMIEKPEEFNRILKQIIQKIKTSHNN